MAFVTNGGVKIHYEIFGQGPPILLGHGFASNMKTTSQLGVSQALMKDHRMIFVDARGYGESDKPHDAQLYRADIIAKDFVSVLDDLKIQRAIYMGYSMGAAIGFQCLARYALPRFNAMILGGSSPYGDVLDADKQENKERLEGLRLAVTKGMEYYLTNYYEPRNGPLDPKNKAERLKHDPNAMLAMAAGIATWPSAADILPSIKIPLLVFGGELDPRFPNIKECVKYLPTATFVSFPGEKHVGTMTDNESLLPHIQKFLEKVDLIAK